MKSISVAASLFGLANAAGSTPYGYASNGADWGGIAGYEGCNEAGGSPIDLSTSLSQFTNYNIAQDNLASAYTNQENAKIGWTGDTTKIALTTGPQRFQSDIGRDFLGAHTNLWDGQQFHFHAGSEHTVDGKRHDLEMHTVHQATVLPNANTSSDFKAAAVGIMFSVNDHNANLFPADELIIDNFFDSLNWADMNDPTSTLVTYGDLLSMVDLRNRWIYTGSVTTPPCAQKVYWNVLQTIYPIKQAHLDMFKAQLARGAGGELVNQGNWREIQAHTVQGLAVVTESAGIKTEPISSNNNPPASGFEAKMGDNAAVPPRQKQVQFVSISPLDRLLNQKDRDDSIRVQVSCRNNGDQIQDAKEYDLNMKADQINNIVCRDGSQPPAGQKCLNDESEYMGCGVNDDYVIELFDLIGQKLQSLATPPSLGKFTVTKEMMECLADDYINVHFEYGKRQELAGAEACFDHSPYIKKDGTEDEIPFTILDICNKANVDRKRCFLYAFQITLFVCDKATPKLLEPKVYAKIQFTSLNSKMIILPGDQIKVSLTTPYTDQEAIRLSPEIYSSAMPTPIKERYQLSNGITRLPCDDRKVADTLQCKDFVVYCTQADQRIRFSVQGAGDVYRVDQTCSEFLADSQNWAGMQNDLDTDFDKFSKTFSDDTTGETLKEFTMDNVKFKNKFDVMQQEKGWFKFTYNIWWRMHSNEPRCYAGVHMTSPTPTCQLQCASKECYLKGPAAPNQDNRRMLVGADGRPDVSPATPGDFSKRFLQKLAGADVREEEYAPGADAIPLRPLDIPTRHLNPAQYIVPQKLLQTFLNNYTTERRQNTATNVIEGEVKDGRAEPIMLSTTFEQDIGADYNYDVEDKLKQDTLPPSSIQINELPKNGKILTTEHDGTIRELKVGDIVSTDSLKNFSYDQGSELCGTDNEEKCSDSFKYTTMSSWIGAGVESESMINLTPVEVEETASEEWVSPVEGDFELSTNMEKVESLEAENVNTAAPVESTNCSDSYPTMLINFMITLLVVMVSMLVASLVYINYKRKQMATKKVTQDKDFDAIVVDNAQEVAN